MEPEFFNVICNLEIRRAERNGGQGLLALLAATSSELGTETARTWQEDMAALQEVLQDALRKSDVLCRFGQQQFMVLLPNTTLEQGQRILQRLAASLKDRELLLRSRLQPLTPHDKT